MVLHPAVAIDDGGVGQTLLRSMEILKPEALVVLDLNRGDELHVTDQLGGQVCSLLLYSTADKSECLSNSVTFVQEASIYLTVGNRLWSSKGAVMAEIVGDDIACHDFLVPRSYVVKEPTGLTIMSIKPMCDDDLIDKMIEHGIDPPIVTTPFNIFKNIKVEEVGAVVELPTISEEGDTFVIRAVMDLMVFLITPASKVRSDLRSDSIGYKVVSDESP